MKIAYLTPEYPHEKTGNSGGLGTSIKNLAHALTTLGHEVLILVYGQNKDAVFFDNLVEVHQIKNTKFKGLSWFLTRKKIEKIINNLYNKNKIEIVEAPDWTGITSFIKLKKCPIIIKLHGSDTYFCHLDNRPVKFWNKFHEKQALKNANGHISVSQFTADLSNNVFGLNVNFKIIPNGIDLNKFTRDNELTNEEDLQILYFGTLIRKKGVLELPFIFNKIIEKKQNVALHLIGSDSFDILTKTQSTWKLMENLFSEEAKENVVYHGKVDYLEMKNYISKATVCVFPSFAEALPVSWLEAMAVGKAVVASNIGWGKEIVDHGINGFIENPKNHENYSKYLLQILNEPNLRMDFEKKARIKTETYFDIIQIAKKNLDYYATILK